MDDIRVDDFNMMYSNSIVMLKNKPVYVHKLLNDKIVAITDLLANRMSFIKFADLKLKPPTLRIGFVNIHGSVVYVRRVPVRKYKVGICAENTKVHLFDELIYPLGAIEAKERVGSFKCPEIVDAMLNKYPSLKDAFRNAIETGGACAFDHQFAITYRGDIYYKTSKVGKLPIVAGKYAVNNIKWNAGKEHLHLLLKDNHEA